PTTPAMKWPNGGSQNSSTESTTIQIAPSKIDPDRGCAYVVISNLREASPPAGGPCWSRQYDAAAPSIVAGARSGVSSARPCRGVQGLPAESTRVMLARRRGDRPVGALDRRVSGARRGSGAAGGISDFRSPYRDAQGRGKDFGRDSCGARPRRA